jgi:hypothetical protein
MALQDTSFFVEDAPLEAPETGPLRRLAAWQRVALCLAFLALMVVYLGWLLEG